MPPHAQSRTAGTGSGTTGSVRWQGPVFAVLALLTIAGPASAQTATNITVTVNGLATAPGTYNSANIFQATCEGTESISATSGDPAIFRLQWTPQSEDTIFWDTAADCNTGNVVTDDAGTVISGGDVTGPITIDPAGNAGIQSYGVGAGNVEINMRTVLANALPTIDGNIFDGGNACAPPEKGILYVCVTQQELGTTLVGQTQTQIAWYMAVNYDTFTPEAPSGVTGQTGDSNIMIDWSFSDSNFPEQFLTFNVYYQPDPNGLVPDSDGNCGAAVDTDGGLQAAGKSIWQVRAGGGGSDAGDGGCPADDLDTSGVCCGDAGVGSAGSCNVINIAGACGGCTQDSDCGGNNACVVDQAGNPYCGEFCSLSDNVGDGGNLDCPVGFTCEPQTDYQFSGNSVLVCAPQSHLCDPIWVTCGSCLQNSDCPSGVCIFPDAGGSYCAVHCGADGGCLGATECLPITYNSVSSHYCTLSSFECYDPTLLGTIVDGGGEDAGSGTLDAGAGGSGVDTSGWNLQSFSGTLSSAQITGLTNGVCYDFVVQTALYDGTLGDNSTEVVIAPVKNYDFWRLYQQDGGPDAGGLHCQAAGGGVGILAAVALLLGFDRSRRNRRSRSGSSGRRRWRLPGFGK